MASVLVVDDDVAIRSTLTRWLAKAHHSYREARTPTMRWK